MAETQTLLVDGAEYKKALRKLSWRSQNYTRIWHKYDGEKKLLFLSRESGEFEGQKIKLSWAIDVWKTNVDSSLWKSFSIEYKPAKNLEKWLGIGELEIGLPRVVSREVMSKVRCGVRDKAKVTSISEAMVTYIIDGHSYDIPVLVENEFSGPAHIDIIVPVAEVSLSPSFFQKRLRQMEAYIAAEVSKHGDFTDLLLSIDSEHKLTCLATDNEGIQQCRNIGAVIKAATSKVYGNLSYSARRCLQSWLSVKGLRGNHSVRLLFYETSEDKNVTGMRLIWGGGVVDIISSKETKVIQKRCEMFSKWLSQDSFRHTVLLSRKEFVAGITRAWVISKRGNDHGTLHFYPDQPPDQALEITAQYEEEPVNPMSYTSKESVSKAFTSQTVRAEILEDEGVFSLTVDLGLLVKGLSKITLDALELEWNNSESPMKFNFASDEDMSYFLMPIPNAGKD